MEAGRVYRLQRCKSFLEEGRLLHGRILTANDVGHHLHGHTYLMNEREKGRKTANEYNCVEEIEWK